MKLDVGDAVGIGLRTRLSKVALKRAPRIELCLRPDGDRRIRDRAASLPVRQRDKQMTRVKRPCVDDHASSKHGCASDVNELTHFT